MGNSETNERGRVLLEVFSCVNITLSKVGNVNTFNRGKLDSDLNSLRKYPHWHISEEYNIPIMPTRQYIPWLIIELKQ